MQQHRYAGASSPDGAGNGHVESGERDAHIAIVPINPNDSRFTEWADVFMTVGQRQWGRDTTAYPADEIAHMWNQPSQRHLGFAAMNQGRVMGAAALGLNQLDNHHLAGFVLASLAEGGEGLAVRERLLAAVEAAAREDGRTTLLVETQTRVNADDEDANFLAAHGFLAAQRCARNVQRIPMSAAVEAEMKRVIALDDGYRIETCVGRIPDAWLEERARLGAMMSTDTPLGDLEIQPESWTPQRVREMFDVDEARGRTVVEAVAWHEDSGRMVAFTHVSVPKETPWVAYQDDTLVENIHRGHRLGYRVKAAVSLLLPTVAPLVEVQRTWNDETNVHMLRINSELGYEREGTMVEWQKRLD